MTGRHGTIVKNASELTATPAVLLTITEYAPTLAGDTALTVKVLVVEPKTLPPSLKLVRDTPLSCRHW